MSKKLLALLVAVSACFAFGCSDDDGDSCKANEKRCDGNNAQICTNGSWKTIKCEKGCDKEKNACIVDPGKPDVKCTATSTSECTGTCSTDKLAGWFWSKDALNTVDCPNADCTDANGFVKCGSKSPVCTATSTSKCTGACSADKKAGYYWSKDALKTIDCSKADCTDANGFVQCGETPACTATSTERCTVACNDDKSVGYYWNSTNNQVGERKCPNKDCTIEGTSVKCGNGQTQCKGDQKESGGAIGDCCDTSKYVPDCTNMLRCSKGEIKAISCKEGKSCKLNTDGNCSVESGNYCKDGKYDKTKYPLGYFECA